MTSSLSVSLLFPVTSICVSCLALSFVYIERRWSRGSLTVLPLTFLALDVDTPSTSPMLRPGSPNGSKQVEGSLYSYSWVPLKSLKRAIVVFYNSDGAERARQANDRYYFPPTASTPEITVRAFRGAHTVLVPVQ